MTLRSFDQGIYIEDNFESHLKFDAIIFDCDGVLIDVSFSYDLVIQKTTSYILKNLVNITTNNIVTSEIIEGFKSTGGFNDEVDLTYASILSFIAAHKLNEQGHEFIFRVIENTNETGINSVEKYLETLVDLSEIKKKLDYPGRHTDNILYSTFDQMFYGPELYYKLFNQKSKFDDPGLISNDQVLLEKELLEILKKLFNNKIAIVSGRGLESISFSLKDLLKEFDLVNSVFLEDESREFAKPNPQSLIRSIKGLESSHCLFVGDSMEDFIMAKKSTEMRHQCTFCGIYGTSKHPETKRNLFEKNNASIILESISLLPKALNLV